MASHVFPPYAYLPVSQPAWDPWLKQYTSCFWSYATNMWVPYMELATTTTQRSASVSSYSSSNSSSYASSYASSYSSSNSRAQSFCKDQVERVAENLSLSRSRIRDWSHVERMCVYPRSRTTHRRCSQSRSRSRSRRYSGDAVKGRPQFSPRSPRRSSDSHHRCSIPMDCEKGNRHYSRSRSVRKTGTNVYDIGESRNWESWTPNNGVAEKANNSWDRNWYSPGRWSAWERSQGKSWQWTKKRPNKKRGGWRVQVKKASMRSSEGLSVITPLQQDVFKDSTDVDLQDNKVSASVAAPHVANLIAEESKVSFGRSCSPSSSRSSSSSE